MHCELVVPDLFSAGAKARYPALEQLLARGRRTIEGPKPQLLERWLHDAFSLEEKVIPAGALSLIAGNRDPGSDSWLRADPVHLRLMRDRVVVMPAEALAISQEEADAFCASLNEHFAGVMEIVPLDAARWCARVFGKALDLDDVPALQVAGREIRLSRERDREVTEIQMVLHEHPVNAAREARGEPPVNSLWLWGAGPVGKSTSHWNSVCADEPLVMGLAMLARAHYRSLPSGATQWLQSAPEDGRHLIVLDTLRAPALLLDVDRYHERLAELEKNWFAPLLKALRQDRIGMLTLHVPNAAEAVSFEAIRGDLRRFWRLAKPIERYA
ncbi:MAG TPA: hypothetical protein VM756_12740 [Burkholderiales bacterium]|nr:hypothetical protein [Burkholderiales bacterium]